MDQKQALCDNIYTLYSRSKRKMSALDQVHRDLSKMIQDMISELYTGNDTNYDVEMLGIVGNELRDVQENIESEYLNRRDIMRETTLNFKKLYDKVSEEAEK